MEGTAESKVEKLSKDKNFSCKGEVIMRPD